ncbi:hypothetical protein HCN44_007751 [Aphidius gifuensis]|uniref:Uncharacterized protein n=1 Tax=Aphidius gifuensis TaxID=684658 RepID=A0A834XQV9_APHGI|nr:hypothetical protein HCN44_007751 [Aphidius gifuensis]
MSSISTIASKRGRPPKDDKKDNNNNMLNQLSALIDTKNVKLKQEIIDEQKELLASNYQQIMIEQKKLELLIDEKLNEQAIKYNNMRDEMIVLIDEKLNTQNTKSDELKSELNLLIENKMLQLEEHINDITVSFASRLKTCEDNITNNEMKLQTITAKINDIDNFSSQHIASINDELSSRLNNMSNIIVTGLPEDNNPNISSNDHKNIDTAAILQKCIKASVSSELTSNIGASTTRATSVQYGDERE